MRTRGLLAHPSALPPTLPPLLSSSLSISLSLSLSLSPLVRLWHGWREASPGCVSTMGERERGRLRERRRGRGREGGREGLYAPLTTPNPPRLGVSKNSQPLRHSFRRRLLVNFSANPDYRAQSASLGSPARRARAFPHSQADGCVQGYLGHKKRRSPRTLR